MHTLHQLLLKLTSYLTMCKYPNEEINIVMLLLRKL